MEKDLLNKIEELEKQLGKLRKQVAKKSFNDFTWEEIKELKNKNLLNSIFEVGDYKEDILYTGEKVKFYIVRTCFTQ